MKRDQEATAALLNLIEQCDDGTIEDSAYPYSGRGMYGARCVGVNVSDPFRLIARMVANRQYVEASWSMTEEDLAEAIADVRTDSMGRSSQVVYFPSYPMSRAAR
jgi:hypothetical protein